jgi:outer membrane protein
LPIEPYITAGFVWHWPSEVQDASQELVLAVKLYYNIPLPVRIRLGAAEGFSYITKVTYIESYDYEETDYKPSNLLNFLDFSAGLSLGDIFGKSMEPWWVGYSIHHRSGIFEMAQQFGRIKGGSNYQTGYLEYQF